MVVSKLTLAKLGVGSLLGAALAVATLMVASRVPVRHANPPVQDLRIYDAQPGSGVSVGFMTTGVASVTSSVIAQGAAGQQPIRFRAMVLDHPDGQIVFGGGADSVIGAGRVANPFGRVEPNEPVWPEDVDEIVLPTMRWMHTGWAHAQPELPIRVGRSDHWYAFRGPWPGRYGYNRDRLEELRGRMTRITWERAPRAGFPRSYDYFGDDSVHLVALNGATKDEIGALVVLDSGRTLLVIGDAVWTHDQIVSRQRRAQWLGWTMDRNRTQLLNTQSRLHQLWRDYEVELVPLLDGSLDLPEYPDVWR